MELGAAGRASAPSQTDRVSRAHHLVLSFTYGGWYEANAWLRAGLTVPAWLVVSTSSSGRAACPSWGWAALVAASLGALLAVAHQRWPVWLESHSDGSLYEYLSGRRGGPLGWLAAHAVPHTGTFQANLSGTTEALGGLGVALLAGGPWALTALPAPSRLLLAVCALAFLLSAISQWLMDAAWYVDAARVREWGRWLLGAAVAAAVFVVFGPLTGDTGHPLISGAAAAVPFVALLAVIPGENLFVATALASAEGHAAGARAEVAVEMHGSVKQPARLLGEWFKVAGVDAEDVLASHQHLLLSIERMRRALSPGDGGAGSLGAPTLAETIAALRVLEQTTGRGVRVDAPLGSDGLVDPLLSQVVNDLVVNAMASGTGTVQVLIETSTESAAAPGRPLMRVRVADSGAGPDPATWLTSGAASTTQLAHRLRSLGGDLTIVRDEADRFLGVEATWFTRPQNTIGSQP